MSTMINE